MAAQQVERERELSLSWDAWDEMGSMGCDGQKTGGGGRLQLQPLHALPLRRRVAVAAAGRLAVAGVRASDRGADARASIAAVACDLVTRSL